MCGRYTLVRLQDILNKFPWIEGGPGDLLSPRYNIAPTQPIPVVVNHEGAAKTRAVSWGFKPFWAKEGDKLKPINAKGETVGSSKMFRQSFEKRRCLIPTDGFYEWKGAKPPKVPHYIRVLGDAPFFFGGIREGDTAAILTTTPNEMMADIHNRMPVIIDGADAVRWLDPATTDVADLLKPFQAERMEAFAVSTKVNNVRNQGEELVEPAKD
jgi:putative SOS response-associated peptidase YedK